MQYRQLNHKQGLVKLAKYQYQIDLSSFYQTIHLYLLITILAHSQKLSTPIIPDFKDGIGIIVLTDHLCSSSNIVKSSFPLIMARLLPKSQETQI
jgi:hypothetical protein